MPRDSLSYRQVIPSIYGACDKDKALAQGDIDLSKNKTIETKMPSGVAGSKNFLYLEATDKSLKKLEFKIDYKDGQNENIVINRSDRIINNGRYFLEFSDTMKGDIVAMSVGAPDMATGSLQVRVCKLPAN